MRRDWYPRHAKLGTKERKGEMTKRKFEHCFCRGSNLHHLVHNVRSLTRSATGTLRVKLKYFLDLKRKIRISSCRIPQSNRQKIVKFSQKR